jgi:hypothetical protein
MSIGITNFYFYDIQRYVICKLTIKKITHVIFAKLQKKKTANTWREFEKRIRHLKMFVDFQIRVFFFEKN